VPHTQNVMNSLITNHPEINIKAQRYFLVGKVTYYFAFAIHCTWIPIFYLMNAHMLAIFNIFSALTFVLTIWMNKKKMFIAAVSIAVIEVVIHQILCVVYLGWDTGFQYYIISAIMLPFLTDQPKKLIKFSLGIFCITTFLYLKIFYYSSTPIYSLSPKIVNFFNVTNITFAMLVIVACSYVFNNSVNTAEEALEIEKKRSDDLLHNILPAAIVSRLKKNKKTIADGFTNVSVLFLDIVGFTALSSTKTPEELVDVLNEIFIIFDDLAEKYNLEKIKTIGDSYMVAAGVPKTNENDAERIVHFALELTPSLESFNSKSGNSLKIRVGINSGPVVAGVIGKKKFIYDLWGDAVNIASRMESHGVVGKVQVSESTYNLVTDKFNFTKREKINVKGKGMMQTYIVDNSL
jgi:adenylate cyclase